MGTRQLRQQIERGDIRGGTGGCRLAEALGGDIARFGMARLEIEQGG